MSDLLDELEALDLTPASEVHALMPDMLTACRLCTGWDCPTCLDRIAHTSDCGWTFGRARTTCPDCLITDIEANATRMQSRQAVAS